MRVVVGLIVSAVLAGEARAADQFDLICKGESKLSSEAKPKPLETRYRVDLAQGLWCENECANVSRIQDATATRITFEEHGEALRSGSAVHIIERTTGLWYRNIGGQIYLVIKGRCDPAPFSGINPPTKF